MKKTKAAEEGGEDRISELPDALLHQVLSLLPVDEAVQTSVLARRWRGLWKGLPVLRLVGPKKRFPSAEDFDRAIDLHALVRILQHTPILEKLTLQLRSDENFLSAARGESRKHVRIEQSFSCANLKEVNIECEEKLRVKDKVRQIVKILSKSGIRNEQISVKKIPRPEGFKLTIDI
ncbi:hypothetical protein SEVIR_8G161100v4 [Setaria viridis]